MVKKEKVQLRLSCSVLIKFYAFFAYQTSSSNIKLKINKANFVIVIVK